MERHALVCGASMGIGRAAAMALAQDFTVTLLARDAHRLEDVQAAIEAAGGTAHVLVADLDDRDGLVQAVGDHVARHGPVHVLVNNTGGPPAGRLLDVEGEEDFLVPFGRHVLAAHRLVRLLLPGMEAARYGRIINVISTSVREPIPNLGISNTIRAAMAGWAKTLSKELPPGVTVNSVLPGFTDTERLASLRSANAQKQGKSEQEIHDAWIAATPERRLGRPEELGAAIAFLAGEQAGFIRGVVLPVDGGRLNSI